MNKYIINLFMHENSLTYIISGESLNDAIMNEINGGKFGWEEDVCSGMNLDSVCEWFRGFESCKIFKVKGEVKTIDFF